MSVNSDSSSMGYTMMSYINDAIKSSIADAFDKAIEQAVKDAQEKRDDVVAKTAIRMTSWVQMQENKTNLVITIEKPKE